MSCPRGFLSETRVLALLAGILAGCGTSSTSPPVSTPDAGGGAVACVASALVLPSLCTSNPVSPLLTDLSGTWVLETIGAQTVTAPGYANPFRLQSIGVILVQVVQTGSDVAVSGRYCDRIQHDNSDNPAKVVIPDVWRKTEFPIQRSGTFADDGTGKLVLTLPTAIEIPGADPQEMVDPACDALPTDPNDPRVVDVDHDGNPGLSVALDGLVTGVLSCVQRQSTALSGVAVAADRIEGGMAFGSEQSVLASQPESIKTVYRMSKSGADSAACASTFVMVKVPDAADAGVVGCDWVRENENGLLGL